MVLIRQGFSHPIKSDGSGAVVLDYIILDTDGLSWGLQPTYRYQQLFQRQMVNVEERTMKGFINIFSLLR